MKIEMNPLRKFPAEQNAIYQ